jgi:hypothetical protein
VQPRAWRFWALLLGLTALALAPLFIVPSVIGVDYPNHLGVVRILRLWFTDRSHFHEQFGTRLWQPYWGWYLPVLALSSVMSIDLAAKLVVAASLIAFPVGLERLARRIGIDRRVALLAVPLMLNYSFYWGFVTFLAGLALAILALPRVVDFAENDKHRDLVWLAVWSLAICVAHATAWAFFAAWAGWIVATTTPRPSPRRLLRYAATLVAPLAFLASWEHGVESSGNLAWLRAHPGHHSVLKVKLPIVLHNSFIAGPDLLNILLLVLFLAALALASRGQGAPRRGVIWGGLAGWMAIAFLTLPQEVAGLSFAYQRFLPFIYFFALLLAALEIRRPFAFQALAVLITVVAIPFQWVAFQQVDTELTAMHDCLGKARPGSSLAGLIGLKWPEGTTMPIYLHADAWHTYWNLGPSFTHFMELLPTTPVYWKRDAFGGPPPPEFDWHPRELDWKEHGQYIDYFLIRDFYFNADQFPSNPLEPDVWFLKEGYRQCKMICRAGPWRLWENMRPAAP